ncbi:MAG: M20/M25/M40 family metallo-hydrolase [Gemmatimonadetes bacterium]|jgi:putative aminopeptidase FrvX|nr:M20/M25/M40 family metallo-hydrolase [Gemmatimonadota bacterium]MBT7858674.1 M20/M25/M40 family metallo-hydrolase [Gemmatimonadota bacterium]
MKEKDILPDFLDIALPLLRLPTAPYHEHHIVAAIDRVVAGWAASDAPLTSQRDAAGNMWIRYDGRGQGPWLHLTGHLDHPGFGYVEHLTARDLLFERLGGVPAQFCRNAPVQIHASDGSHRALAGTIISYIEEGLFDGEPRPAFRVRLDEGTEGSQLIGPGSFAMWDLPWASTKKQRLRAPACDDVAGVAVALAVLSQVIKQKLDTRLGLLLTRAEETGFGGMLDLVTADGLDREAVYINIECSSCLSGAPLGEGPVIRVGDRRWLFDPVITAALVAAAGGSASREAIPVQRRLMDGGTCEATVLSRAGVPTAAVALPLGNYHNTGKHGVRPEVIDLNDAAHLIRLLLRLAESRTADLLDPTLDPLGKELSRRHQAQSPRLRQSAPGLPS